VKVNWIIGLKNTLKVNSGRRIYLGATVTWIRVYIFCEGETEETFIKEILVPHFNFKELELKPILIGGLQPRSFPKVKQEIKFLCRRDRSTWVSTMVDYYEYPGDLHGKTTPGSQRKKAKTLIPDNCLHDLWIYGRCSGFDYGWKNQFRHSQMPDKGWNWKQ